MIRHRQAQFAPPLPSAAVSANTPHSFFKTLIDTTVTVELKNDIQIRGTLKSVDQYLNIKLDDITVVDEIKYPHLSAVKNVFIRGSVVRYVHLPAAAVDVALLEDATRRGKLGDGMACFMFYVPCLRRPYKQWTLTLLQKQQTTHQKQQQQRGRVVSRRNVEGDWNKIQQDTSWTGRLEQKPLIFFSFFSFIANTKV